MGDPPRGGRLQTEMHGLRTPGHGDAKAGGEEHERPPQAGMTGNKTCNKIVKNEHKQLELGLSLCYNTHS